MTANTVTRIENGADAKGSTLNALRRALEAAGCIFIDENGEGPGVRLRKSRSTVPLNDQIEALEGRIADMPKPGGRTPEAGMNTMRRAVAENDLVALKNKRTKGKK